MTEDDFEPTDIDPTRDTIEKIEKRCKPANIKIDVDYIEGDPWTVTLSLPNGKAKRSLLLCWEGECTALLGIKFERYVFLGPHEAIWRQDTKEIQALIEPLGSRGGRPTKAAEAILKAISPDVDKNSTQTKLVLSPPNGISLPIIEINKPSKELTIISSRDPSSFLMMRITGLAAEGHDDALAKLEKIANSTFFSIEANTGIALGIVRDRPIGQRTRGSTRKNQSSIIKYPTSEYDKEPISLYWYARSAGEMPLLQFLAFYQCMEYYFPIFSEEDAKKHVKGIVLSPSFDPHRDADISRLLGSIKYKKGKGFGDERSQLKATLSACISQNSIAEFIESSDDRKKFFLNPDLLQSQKLLPNDDRLVEQTAERIYNLRCKVVHTKSGDEKADFELLLPYSPEVDHIHHDIDLIKHCAQKVLISTCKKIRI